MKTFKQLNEVKLEILQIADNLIDLGYKKESMFDAIEKSLNKIKGKFKKSVVVKILKDNGVKPSDIQKVVKKQRLKEDLEETTVAANIPTGPNIGPMKPSGSFRGLPYFNCDDSIFSRCLQGKKFMARWKGFTGNEDFAGGLRKWIKSNPKKPFMLRNEKTGTFIFARRSF